MELPLKVCGCERNWTIESFVRDKIEEIKKSVGSDGCVICGLSGEIDSSYAVSSKPPATIEPC